VERHGKARDFLEANQLILHELQPYNHGTIKETATITNNVAIGQGTIIHSRTTIRGPAIIGDHVAIRNTEIENSIIMEGAHKDV